MQNIAQQVTVMSMGRCPWPESADEAHAVRLLPWISVREQIHERHRSIELALEPPHDLEQFLERRDPRRPPRDPDPGLDQLCGDLTGQVARERKTVS